MLELGTKITVIDNTLREGEQTPGVTLSVSDKLEILTALSDAGVAIADMSMPVTHPDEETAVREAVAMELPMRIGASVRAIRDEAELALKCGAQEIFVIAPVSDVHLENRLRISRNELLRRVEDLSRLIDQAGAVCNIVAEDASRSDIPFIVDAFEAGRAHSSRFFICDTVGLMAPGCVRDMVSRSKEALGPEFELGVHCHNDFGLATANTVAAIEEGALAPTMTVNGIGERAGNASLVEVVMIAQALFKLDTGIRAEKLVGLSKLVEEKTGFLIPSHAPLVGANSFRHESGIHVDGISKNRAAYEPFDPVTLDRFSEIVGGKHSGKSYVVKKLAERGVVADDETIDRILKQAKEKSLVRHHEEYQRIKKIIESYQQEQFEHFEQYLWDALDEITG